METTESCEYGGESTLPVSSDDTAVTTCEHSDQLLVHGTSELIAGNVAASGEMCLPVEALVKRGKKLTNQDQSARYPLITGTLSERCIQSVEHIVQVVFHWLFLILQSHCIKHQLLVVLACQSKSA